MSRNSSRGPAATSRFIPDVVTTAGDDDTESVVAIIPLVGVGWDVVGDRVGTTVGELVVGDRVGNAVGELVVGDAVGEFVVGGVVGGASARSRIQHLQTSLSSLAVVAGHHVRR